MKRNHKRGISTENQSVRRDQMYRSCPKAEIKLQEDEESPLLFKREHTKLNVISKMSSRTNKNTTPNRPNCDNSDLPDLFDSHEQKEQTKKAEPTQSND